MFFFALSGGTKYLYNYCKHYQKDHKQAVLHLSALPYEVEAVLTKVKQEASVINQQYEKAYEKVVLQHFYAPEKYGSQI